jgi:hypothetical protein
MTPTPADSTGTVSTADPASAVYGSYRTVVADAGDGTTPAAVNPSGSPTATSRPMLDFSALTADPPSDSRSGLWAGQPRHRHRIRTRRGLVTGLVTTVIAVMGVAAALVAPRFLDSSRSAAPAKPESSPWTTASPSTTVSSPPTAASPTAAAVGPGFTDIIQRGTVANLSPDGSLLALVGAGTAPGTAHLVTTYDVANGAALARIVGPPAGGEITEVAYSPNGATIAFATTTSLVLVDPASSRTRDIAVPAGLAGAAFSGIEFLDGGTSIVALAQAAPPEPGAPGRQAAAQGTSRLTVFDTASGALVVNLARNPTTSPTTGATSRGSTTPPTTMTTNDVIADPSGQLLAVVTPDAVEFWDRRTGTQVTTVPVSTLPASSGGPASAGGRQYFSAPAAWRTDGKLMTCLGSVVDEVPTYEPVIVDPIGGQLVPLAIDGTTGIGPCAFDVAGTLLAAPPDPASGDVVVWDVARNVERARVTVRGDAAAGAAGAAGAAARPILSGDGRTLAVLAGDDVQVWTLPRPD